MLKERLEQLTIKKGSYREVVIRSIILFFTALVVLFALYGLVANRRESRSETEARAEKRLIQISTQLDGKLSNLENYYLVSSKSKEITDLINNTSYYYDDDKLNKLREMLLGGGMFDDIVADFLLFDSNAQMIVGSEGAFAQDEVAIEKELVRLLNDDKTKSGSFLTSDTGLLSFAVKIPSDSSAPSVLLVIEISTGNLIKQATELLSDKEQLYVTDGNGNLVLSSVESADAKVFLERKELFEKKGLFRIKGSQKYKLATGKSTTADWNYIFICPQIKSLHFGLTFALIGALILVIPACVLFLVFTYRIYSPVDKLFKKVVPETETDKESGEFDYIEKKLTNLAQDEDRLKETVDRQQDNIQQMFELHLINDGIRSEDEWNDYFETLKLPQYECFVTTVCVLDVRYNSDIQKSINEDAICLQLIEDMPEDVKKLLWMPPVYNSCTIFSLIGSNNEDDLIKNVNSYYGLMQDYCKNSTGFYIIMGVSGTHTRHKQIRLAYRESAMALMYNANGNRDYAEIEQNVLEHGVDITGNLRFYVDKFTENNENPIERYNMKYQNDIQIAIKESDSQKAYKTTDRFAEFLLKTKTTDDALYYTLRYVDCIVMTALESNIPLTEIFPDGARAVYRELISELEPRRIRPFIKKAYIDPVISCLNKHMQDGAHQIMEKIDALLDETHGNILLTECADRLNVSQNYIWKVLKAERGKGFTEYAEKRKIEEAKKLILETNMSIQEIAAALDYANAQNFIRFFSKATGVTPGKFRKMY